MFRNAIELPKPKMHMLLSFRAITVLLILTATAIFHLSTAAQPEFIVIMSTEMGFSHIIC